MEADEMIRLIAWETELSCSEEIIEKVKQDLLEEYEETGGPDTETEEGKKQFAFFVRGELEELLYSKGKLEEFLMEEKKLKGEE